MCLGDFTSSYSLLHTPHFLRSFCRTSKPKPFMQGGRTHLERNGTSLTFPEVRTNDIFITLGLFGGTDLFTFPQHQPSDADISPVRRPPPARKGNTISSPGLGPWEPCLSTRGLCHITSTLRPELSYSESMFTSARTLLFSAKALRWSSTGLHRHDST